MHVPGKEHRRVSLKGLLSTLGRFLEPLFAPDAARRREHDASVLSILKTQRSAVSEVHEQLAAQKTQIARLSQARSAELADLQLRLGMLEKSARRQASAYRHLRKRGTLAEQLAAERERVMDRLQRMASETGPILVGPWTGEVGFELLYWIPFVRWATTRFGIDSRRLVVISRGGTRAWYGELAGRYIDALSLVSVDEFRTRTESSKKQQAVRAFDRALLLRARAETGLSRPALLHPELMYLLFRPFWKRQLPLSTVMDHVAFRRVDAPLDLRPPGLPARYVVTRFYYSGCFPDTAENRAFVGGVIDTLSRQSDVVVLSPGQRVDEHHEHVTSSQHRIHTVDLSARPHENLAVQTAIISGAEAFVGTYGGFAYLAPFCGINALAFYSERNFFSHHLEVAHDALEAIGGGRLDAITVRTARQLGVLSDQPASSPIG